MLTALAIAGYRSLRDVRVALGPLNIVTRPNDSGKSSLYRALRLLVASLAAESGLQSTLWAGPERFGAGVKRGNGPVEGPVRDAPVSLKLGFAGEENEEADNARGVDLQGAALSRAA